MSFYSVFRKRYLIVLKDNASTKNNKVGIYDNGSK